MDIHKEQCMQENIINHDNSVEAASISCFKICKACKKSFTTTLDYKMHIKEHRKVCKIIMSHVFFYDFYFYFLV